MTDEQPIEPPDQPTPCDRCGNPIATRFGGQFIRDRCYDSCGSCCPEFGAGDLWSIRSDEDEGSRFLR